jgi:hypothetical protein
MINQWITSEQAVDHAVAGRNRLQASGS